MAQRYDRHYARLAAYLAAQRVAGVGRVTLPFAALEATILAHPLPPSARSRKHHRRWWQADGAHIYAWEGWLSVGWRVEAVDLAAETVTFARPPGTA